MSLILVLLTSVLPQFLTFGQARLRNYTEPTAELFTTPSNALQTTISLLSSRVPKDQIDDNADLAGACASGISGM